MKTESACRKAYTKEVERQYDPYKEWIEEREHYAVTDSYCNLSYRILFMEECVGNWDVTQYNEDLIVMYSHKGELDDRAMGIILNYMQEHEEVALAYSDEDYIIDEPGLLHLTDEKVLHQIGIDVEHYNPDMYGRVAPWFKPDFSPDTLMSFQYFGNLVVLRTSRIRRTKVDVLTGPDFSTNLYDFFLKVSEKASIGHIHEILFHRHGLPSFSLPHGCRKKYNLIKEEALKRRAQNATFYTDEDSYTHIQYVPDFYPLVSVIIPSKDHPELLKMCIESIRKFTKYPRYEIIVIDNGSANNNRIAIQEMAKTYQFSYVYEKMDFNFSTMCNKGANLAKGELFLFLNDDIEVLQEKWMEIMVGQAMLSHVGAVGAKLLYPNSQLIQHVGISNSIVGPVHRLHNYSDSFSRYYGRNRMTYDYIGVTAACLMIQKNKFQEIDGFCEELRVAYNDVDFCFKLHEKGYHQVVRNDVVMYHHESISRGRDDKGEKKARLDAERTLLYEKHPMLSPKVLEENINGMIDPYCNKTEEWKRNSMFMVGYLFEHERKDCVCDFLECKGKSFVTKEGTEIKSSFLQNPKQLFLDRSQVMMSVDSMECIEHQNVLKGWMLVTKNDNALFEKYLLLKSETGKIYVINPFTVLREDVAKYIEGQTNVLLAGISVRIDAGIIEKGTYRVGALLVSLVSKKKYAYYSDTVWEIEE